MTTYTLAPYVRVGVHGSELFVGFGSMQETVTEKQAFMPTLQLLAELRHNNFSKPEIVQLARTLGCEELLDLLFSKGFVIETGLYNREDRYSRNWLYYNMQPHADPRDIQAKLAQKHVVILGAGGIGNMVAPILATAGVGKITLVDGDTIELSNLTRQYLFDERVVGRPKIEALATALKKRNSATIVETVNLEVKTEADIQKLPSCDLIVLSADSVGLVESVNAYAIGAGTPYVNICYIQDIAVWGPFVVPGKTGCWACQNNLADSYSNPNKDIEAALKTINGVYQAPSFGPINMLASSLAAIDVLRFLGEYGDVQSKNTRIGLWTHNLQFERQDFSRNPDCRVCGDID